MTAAHSHVHTPLADADAYTPTVDAALEELRELTAELQASRTRIVEAGDAARRRIERDLHDGAQQRFVSAAMMLGAVIRAVEHGDVEQLTDRLARVRDELDGGLAELRDLARGIHPTVVSDLGLRAAVDALASHSSVPVTVRGELDRRPAPSVEATLYFTIAEALTNVAKYAGASEAVVTIGGGDGQAEVEISDDGSGGADPANGSGLRGLVDRLGALGGHLHVRSDPGRGTTVHAIVPSNPHDRSGEVACGCCAEGQCRCAA
jgi:signal transduction histidine kinase